MSQNFPDRLDSVQALRGLAAMLVVLMHVAGMQRAILTDLPGDALAGFWDRGYAGVDIFFVISGFIMVYVTRTVSPSAAQARGFLIARIIRIYPLWWAYAALMAMIYFAIFGIPAHPEVSADSGGVLAYLVRSFLLLPQAEPPVLAVGWTLVFEMYFYLIFAVSLLLPRRFLLVIFALWVVQLAAFRLLPLPDYPVLVMMRSPMVLEFIGGACAALLILRYKTVRPWLFLALGAAGLTVSLVYYSGPPHSDNFWRVLAFGLPALMLIYGAVGLEKSGQIAVPGWARRLGDWSYSLYLGHFIVLLVIKNVWEGLEAVGMPAFLHLGAPGVADNLAFSGLGIAVSIVAAAVSYAVFERPVIRALRRAVAV